MMKMRLIYFGLLLNCLNHHTYAQPSVCNSIDGYDTKTLTRAVQWEVTTDYQCLSNLAANCTYYIGFCQPAPMCFSEYSACQNATGSPNMTIIGGLTTYLFHKNESGEEGFYAEFPSGPLQNISNTTQCAPSLRIEFKCNRDAKWLVPLTYNVTATAPEPTDISLDPNDPCSTIMTFDYSGACWNGATNTTTAAAITTTEGSTGNTAANTTTAAGITTTKGSTGNTAKPMLRIQFGLIFLMTFIFQQ